MHLSVTCPGLLGLHVRQCLPGPGKPSHDRQCLPGPGKPSHVRQCLPGPGKPSLLTSAAISGNLGTIHGHQNFPHGRLYGHIHLHAFQATKHFRKKNFLLYSCKINRDVSICHNWTVHWIASED
jgi:hypothetical protein